jgi:hypothetical protein
VPASWSIQFSTFTRRDFSSRMYTGENRYLNNPPRPNYF